MNNLNLRVAVGSLIGAAILVYILWPDAHVDFINRNNGLGGQKSSSISGYQTFPNSPAASANIVKPSSISQSGTQLVPSVTRFNSFPQSVSSVGGHPVQYPGQFAKASVRVDGKNYQLTPNQVGNFPRVSIKPKDTVHVQVAFPNAQPGDPVVVETEDGGNLDDKKMANVDTVDAQQNVQFNFQATSQPGIYHVALRAGADIKVLNFWAGPLQAVRQ